MRKEYAGEDVKTLERLGRYSSPKDALDALIAAQNKIAAGGAKAPLPDNATPEQLAEWRKDNGIPETPDKYAYKLPDGMVVGEQDKLLVEGFLTTAHGMNLPPAQVEKTLSWYFSEQEKQLTALHANDAVGREKGIEALRSDWGTEYQLNLGIVDGFLNLAPAGVKDAILGGRLADGTPIGNNADVLRWFASLGRELNPTSTVTNSTGVQAAQAIATEKATLEKLMGNHESEYWKGSQSESMQKRYRELLDVESKIRK